MATWRGDRWVYRNGYYQPWNSGLRALAQSSKMENEMMSWARILASAADRGESKYAAAPYTVSVGWHNEWRRGAIAYESERAWRDVRDERLKATARAMGSRVPSKYVEYTRKDGVVRMATQAQYDAWMKARGEL